MKLYVDGNLEATDSSDNAPVVLNTTMYLAGGYNGFLNGLLDDVRIYATSLTANDVAILAGITSGLTLADALDGNNLTWTTGGDASWFPQTTVTQDDADAAQSGVIGDDKESWIETTVTGPGTLSFWWKVSSDDGYDYLEFYLDGGFDTDLTGDSGWQQRTYEISPGPKTLKWRYYKDSSGSDGLDAAFLDQVSFVPTVVVPSVGGWTITGSMRVARSRHTANLLPNGKVLVSGGSDTNGYHLASAELYNPATAIWSDTGALLGPRSAHTSTLLRNGKVLIAGGVSNVNSGVSIRSAELYGQTLYLQARQPRAGITASHSHQTNAGPKPADH